jgi:hypothetical protein
VHPADGGETGLVGTAGSVRARDFEKAGFALESTARCEGECEGGEFKKFTETVGLGSEDLKVSWSVYT